MSRYYRLCTRLYNITRFSIHVLSNPPPHLTGASFVKYSKIVERSLISIIRINKLCQISLLMVSVLWRDSWLKPLSIYDIETKFCKSCKKILREKDFVTSCEFCEIGIMHDNCANEHILKKHKAEVRKKIELHRDKPLHDFQ